MLQPALLNRMRCSAFCKSFFLLSLQVLKDTGVDPAAKTPRQLSERLLLARDLLGAGSPCWGAGSRQLSQALAALLCLLPDLELAAAEERGGGGPERSADPLVEEVTLPCRGASKRKRSTWTCSKRL